MPRGGPDGGDGGRGGDVVLLCDDSRRDLAEMRRRAHFRAGRGAHGQGKRRHGARGEDRVVLVPPGTQVEGLGGTRYDLLEPGQRAVVAQGGTGGHGNKRFASATRQAPRFAERGLEGTSGRISLRLKLLADAGVIGLPNAGKSSLLRRLTRAAPKVAGYPFTTTEPVLGTLDADDAQLVIADIPGLIAGAARGAGLGHDFLAHVERCRLLVHLVEVGEQADPVAAYETVRGELAAYGAGLAELPELLVHSKRDLVTDRRADELLAEWRRGLASSTREAPPVSSRTGDPDLAASAREVLAISSATGAGLEELRGAILAAVPREPPEPHLAAVGTPGEMPELEAEHRVYRPAADHGFEVRRVGAGAFAIDGRGIEMLARRHDLSNPESLAYLEERLREIGVIAALRDAGFEPGDEVRIGELAFELDPEP